MLLLAGRAAAYFSTLTRPERVKCFVLDDSVIPCGRSKKVELLSFVYDHVIHKTVRGFKLLLGLFLIDQLANYKSLKKKMTNEEFQAAYDEALKIVQPLVGLDRETQFNSITSTLRASFPHFLPYL